MQEQAGKYWVFISIHALREEGDAVSWPASLMLVKFQSTPSARRATHEPDELPGGFFISIHALREEGDQVCYAGRPERHNFNPRPPRGGRQICNSLATANKLFQSTPSARRATRHFVQIRVEHLHISIHALREEGDVRRSATQQAM